MDMMVWPSHSGDLKCNPSIDQSGFLQGVAFRKIRRMIIGMSYFPGISLSYSECCWVSVWCAGSVEGGLLLLGEAAAAGVLGAQRVLGGGLRIWVELPSMHECELPRVLLGEARGLRELGGGAPPLPFLTVDSIHPRCYGWLARWLVVSGACCEGPATHLYPCRSTLAPAPLPSPSPATAPSRRGFPVVLSPRLRWPLPATSPAASHGCWTSRAPMPPPRLPRRRPWWRCGRCPWALPCAPLPATARTWASQRGSPRYGVC